MGAIRLSDRTEVQLSLFDDNDGRKEKLDDTIDKIRKKYGYKAVQRGLLLQNDLMGNLHEEDDFKPFHQSKST